MAGYHVIREHGQIYSRRENPHGVDHFDEIYLDERSFNHLVNFIAENNDPEIEVDQAFSVHRRRGRTFVKVKNYVGVIETRNRTTIEILPKIYLADETDEQARTRKIFLRMLRSLRNTPFRSIDKAHLHTSRFPVLEIFISAFLVELELLYKRGIKQYYTGRSENNEFLKGRLEFSEHIRSNLYRRERFFISYDIFSPDIAHNRVLKETLRYLESRSKLPANIWQIRKFLTIFDEFSYSASLTKDLAMISNGTDRLFSHYDQALMWSRIFLSGESFTNFKGNNLNKAILFPMERIFEDYVASLFRKNLDDYTVACQDRKHHLVEDHNGTKKFRIRPDIVLRKNGQVHCVIDIKWKIIDQNAPSKNYYISQDDMYQLYAYGKKYGRFLERIPLLYLIYPAHADFHRVLEFGYEDGFKLKAMPFNLDPNPSAEHIDCVNEIIENIDSVMTLMESLNKLP